MLRQMCIRACRRLVNGKKYLFRLICTFPGWHLNSESRNEIGDRKTAMEITEYFEKVFPNNPLLGDFALFGYGVNHSKENDCD